MSREIKFRVWDNVDYMSNPFTLQDLMLKKIQFTSECQVMQYTGLKDENGKEIYEGDVVKIFTDDEKENFELWEIAFQEASFKIKKNHFDEQTTITSVFFMPLESDESFYSHELYEVIGNIYENPELLNQK